MLNDCVQNSYLSADLEIVTVVFGCRELTSVLFTGRICTEQIAGR